MNIEIISKKKKEEIEEFLRERYGIKILQHYRLISTAKNRLRIFTGNLTEKDINVLNSLLTIDSIGLYFAFFNNLDNELRIGFDASTLFGKSITKNVLEIDEKQKEEWLAGRDLNYSGNSRGYVFIKHNQDILGMGKLTENKILNFVPKERREN